MSALKLDFCDLRVLAKKPANLSGHPTQVSQYASQGLEQSPSGIPELVYATNKTVKNNFTKCACSDLSIDQP